MKRIAVLLLIIPLILSGCWDMKVFEKIGFMLNIGIESSKNGELMVTYTAPVVGEAKGTKEAEVITTTGSILREARIGLRRRAAKRMEAGKIQQVIISEELTQKRSVHELIEVIERDPVDPIQAWVIIVDGSPREMLENASKKFKDKPRPSVYLNQLLTDSIKSSYVPDTKVFDFDINYFAQGVDPMTPLIKLSGNEILAIGSALFSEDKMVGKLDHRQTFMVLAMRGKAATSDFVSIDPMPGGSPASERKEMATMLKKCRRKIAVEIKNNRPVVNISLNIKGTISEYKWDKLTDESVQKIIEKSISENIKKDCMKVFKYLQEVNSDPIGIGDIVRAKYSSYWKSTDWKEAYRDAEVNVDVKVEIEQFGVID